MSSLLHFACSTLSDKDALGLVATLLAPAFAAVVRTLLKRDKTPKGGPWWHRLQFHIAFNCDHERRPPDSSPPGA